MQQKTGTTFGGALIVAGTCIGGGMLGAPIVTGVGGFLPSAALYLLCWLFMLGTALLFVEVCLWMKQESNLISMAGRTLGPAGRVFAWALYLFLFYTLTTAYCVGSANIVQDLLGEGIAPWIGTLLFLLLFGPVVSMGAFFVDKCNQLFVLGMVLTFSLFLFLGAHEVEPARLLHSDLKRAILGLPVLFAAFGFQGTVPSLVHYLRGDAPSLKRAIFWGSMLPLFTYLVWQAFVLGVLPYENLDVALAQGQNAVLPLKDVLQTPWVYTLGQYFAIFAMVSSFLGVTLGLQDFLADGFKIEKTLRGRLLLGLMTFVPPFLASVLFPNIFLQALRLAGGFGVALLLGLLPVLMVWRGRYVLGFEGRVLLRGGRWVLSLMVLFVALELACEIYHLLG